MEAAKLRRQHSGASSILIPVLVKSPQMREYYTRLHSPVNRWQVAMFFVVFQLGNDSASGSTISNPLSKPEAIKLLNVSPSWLTVGPRFAPARILTREVPPSRTHQPFFVSPRIINRSDFAIFLSPGKCLVPSEIFVKIFGASTLEYAVENDVGTRACASLKPTLCLSVICS